MTYDPRIRRNRSPWRAILIAVRLLRLICRVASNGVETFPRLTDSVGRILAALFDQLDDWTNGW